MKKIKRILCLVLIACLLVSALCLPASAAWIRFPDVTASNWFYPYVMSVAEVGLVAGHDSGYYGPYEQLTWAQTLTFSVRLDQWLQGERPYSTSDQGSPWYQIYVDYAFRNGFISSVPANPNKPITRGEAANLFAPVLDKNGYWYVNDLPNDYFSDVPYYNEYHYGVMMLATAGIVNGMEPGYFGVNEGLQRCQAATIVARMAGLADPVIIDPTAGEQHSDLYIPGVSVEDMIMYFEEVVLDSEIGATASSKLVQKWTSPIYYTLKGSYNAADYAALQAFTDELNSIYGFPGIYPAYSAAQSNLDINFCNGYEMVSIMGDPFDQSYWGGVRYWYNGSNQIYDGVICVRNDIPQRARESIIVEEIYNGLGPVQDTTLRPDSVIYQWSNDTLHTSDVDKVILQLLYHPEMRCGLNAAGVERVIRNLYW